MTRVQVYDPFAGSGIDDLFRGFFAPVRRDADSPVSIKVDVTENDKGYVVHAEVPGVRKDDILVTIEGNQVSISAEVKRETEQKEGERALRSEEGLRDAYLIALSGYASEEARQRSSAAGFDAHLAKPPDLSKLEATLAAASPPRQTL